MAKDPVCGMTVAENGEFRLVHQGKSYHFCGKHCLMKFHAAPEQYLTPSEKAIHAAHDKSTEPSGLEYTCPMHPEVRQNGPGACPKCGMALEPVTTSAAPAEKIEYTCPMHPEVVQDHPGNCPKCGMALEPRTVAAPQEDNAELRDMTRRFWVSVALAAPGFMLAIR